jgi:hypothetical protein
MVQELMASSNKSAFYLPLSSGHAIIRCEFGKWNAEIKGGVVSMGSEEPIDQEDGEVGGGDTTEENFSYD